MQVSREGLSVRSKGEVRKDFSLSVYTDEVKVRQGLGQGDIILI